VLLDKLIVSQLVVRYTHRLVLTPNVRIVSLKSSQGSEVVTWDGKFGAFLQISIAIAQKCLMRSQRRIFAVLYAVCLHSVLCLNTLTWGRQPTEAGLSLLQTSGKNSIRQRKQGKTNVQTNGRLKQEQ
jgi:hypothetical protein